MNMPGFTAELSAYKTRSSYRIACGNIASEHSGLLPAQWTQSLPNTSFVIPPLPRGLCMPVLMYVCTLVRHPWLQRMCYTYIGVVCDYLARCPDGREKCGWSCCPPSATCFEGHCYDCPPPGRACVWESATGENRSGITCCDPTEECSRDRGCVCGPGTNRCGSKCCDVNEECVDGATCVLRCSPCREGQNLACIYCPISNRCLYSGETCSA